METEQYTVGHAIDSLGFGWFQICLSFAVGFAMIGDAMEMMILSILSPALHCTWHISQVQQATLTTVVFLGMMIASSVWGTLADKYGRKPIVIWTSVFLFYFGLLTSFSPSFNWVLFLRFLVGVFIGGVPQASVLYTEYLPSNARGKAILTMSFFWAIGSFFEALLAYVIMPNYGNDGWRYLVGLSTIPLGLLLILSQMLPESPMYLAATGQRDQVERQLNKVAQLNGKPQLLGTVILETESKNSKSRGSIKNLLNKDNIKLTLMVWIMWFVGACAYYGTVLISTELLNSSNDICRVQSSDRSELTHHSQIECSIKQCEGLQKDDYISLIWTTFAEFPGTIFALFLIDRVGRKKTLAIQSFLFAVSTFLVIECSMSRNLLVFLLFCSRGLSGGLLQTVYVYTPEVYETENRSLALGCGSASARVGAMITPYIAQVLLRSSLYAACSVYAILGMIATVTALYLPIETLGMDITTKHNKNSHKDDHQSISSSSITDTPESQSKNRY